MGEEATRRVLRRITVVAAAARAEAAEEEVEAGGAAAVRVSHLRQLRLTFGSRAVSSPCPMQVMVVPERQALLGRQVEPEETVEIPGVLVETAG